MSGLRPRNLSKTKGVWINESDLLAGTKLLLGADPIEEHKDRSPALVFADDRRRRLSAG